jgi:3'(2'), 5'-bisphosphate nucleotidase
MATSTSNFPGPLTREDIDQVIEVAQEAGDAILDIYEGTEDVEIDRKADDSPLTEADRASHRRIVEGLTRLPVEIPILSEEATDEISDSTRRSWNRFWLVDPLDGTKEFIKHNDEFTVNIALVEDGKPVIGIVHVPANDRTFVALPTEDPYVLGDDNRHVLEAEPPGPEEPVKVVVSRSHLNEATENYVDRIEQAGHEVDLVRAGSSLKFCRIAEGQAHLYPRLAPTMEWDTAAAHAVLEAAGGTIVETDERQPLTDEPLTYNKENLTNPYFVAAAAPELLRLG